MSEDNYDDLAQQASDETDEQLASGLKNLAALSPEEQKKMFPDISDEERVKVANLIAEINAGAAKTKNAWKDFSKAAGSALLRVARKVVLG